MYQIDRAYESDGIAKARSRHYGQIRRLGRIKATQAYSLFIPISYEVY